MLNNNMPDSCSMFNIAEAVGMIQYMFEALCISFSSFSMHCRMIENLGAKTLVMELVNHSNTEIRMQALLSIQKMMVQNWSVLFCTVNSVDRK